MAIKKFFTHVDLNNNELRNVVIKLDGSTNLVDVLEGLETSGDGSTIIKSATGEFSVKSDVFDSHGSAEAALEEAKSYTDTELGLLKTDLEGQISGAVAGAFHFKGSVPHVADLETVENPQEGWVYRVAADNSEYAYDGTNWIELGTIFDASALESDITGLESRVGTLETGLAKEIKDRGDAITTLSGAVDDRFAALTYDNQVGTANGTTGNTVTVLETVSLTQAEGLVALNGTTVEVAKTSYVDGAITTEQERSDLFATTEIGKAIELEVERANTFTTTAVSDAITLEVDRSNKYADDAVTEAKEELTAYVDQEIYNQARVEVEYHSFDPSQHDGTYTHRSNQLGQIYSVMCSVNGELVELGVKVSNHVVTIEWNGTIGGNVVLEMVGLKKINVPV